MNRKYHPLILFSAFLAGFLFLTACPISAAEDVAELKKQIQELQQRVNELEAAQNQNNLPSPNPFPRAQNRYYDPFAEMQRMQDKMNRLFEESFSYYGRPSGGAFNTPFYSENDFQIKETDDGYEVRFDTSGLDAPKVDVQINQNSITVKGEYSSENKEEQPQGYFQSRSFGSFVKTIPLPVDADTSRAKTEQKGDSLVVQIPKKS